MRALLCVAWLLLAAGCIAPGHGEVREWPKAWGKPPCGNCLVTIWGTIYVPTGRLGEFSSPNPAPATEALLAHEMVHVERQRDGSVIDTATWHARYFYDREFRWGEERRAYEREIEVLRARGGVVRRVDVLEAVLSPIYVGMVSKREAEDWLDGLGIIR